MRRLISYVNWTFFVWQGTLAVYKVCVLSGELGHRQFYALFCLHKHEWTEDNGNGASTMKREKNSCKDMAREM